MAAQRYTARPAVDGGDGAADVGPDSAVAEPRGYGLSGVALGHGLLPAAGDEAAEGRLAVVGLGGVGDGEVRALGGRCAGRADVDDATGPARAGLDEHNADVWHGRKRDRQRAERVALRDVQAPPCREPDLVECLLVDAAFGPAALPLAVPPLAAGAALGDVVHAEGVQLVEGVVDWLDGHVVRVVELLDF